jgi:tetratricopeptide (TPR) repeat protein
VSDATAPQSQPAQDLWFRLSPLALGLATLVAVLPFVHSDVTWFDGGELSVAAAGLGVPHPTGFPLVVLLGHLLAAIPLGPIPFRLALLSALSIALATGLIHALAIRHGACPKRALVGAALFPATFVVWLHAGLVEIYAPNVALIALLAWLLLRPEPKLCTAAFLTGLGLGAHATFVLSAGALWLLGWRHLVDRRVLTRLAPFFAGGGAIVLYLPAAASRDPWLNWGDPSSFGGLVDHLTAAGIRSSFAGEMGVGWAANLSASGAWLNLISGGVPWIVAALALGLALNLSSPLHRAALALLAVDGAFSVFLNPMGQADLQTGVPGAWALGLSAALLVGDRRLVSTRRLAVLGLAAAALALVASARLEDRSGDEAAGAWARLALGQVPPGALVLASSDHLASQSLYLEGVEGFRPDLMTVVKQHAPDGALLARRYAKEREPLPPSVLEVPPEQFQRRVYTLATLEAARRPVLWELGDGRLDGPISDRLSPEGALYRLGGFNQPQAAPSGTDWLPQRVGGLAARGDLAFRSRRVLSDGLRLRGVWHLLRQEPELGARVLEGAVALDPSHPPSLLNLAAARYRQGNVEGAIGLLKRALALDPAYEKARANLQRYRASGPSTSP